MAGTYPFWTVFQLQMQQGMCVNMKAFSDQYRRLQEEDFPGNEKDHPSEEKDGPEEKEEDSAKQSAGASGKESSRYLPDVRPE